MLGTSNCIDSWSLHSVLFPCSSGGSGDTTMKMFFFFWRIFKNTCKLKQWLKGDHDFILKFRCNVFSAFILFPSFFPFRSEPHLLFCLTIAYPITQYIPYQCSLYGKNIYTNHKHIHKIKRFLSFKSSLIRSELCYQSCLIYSKHLFCGKYFLPVFHFYKYFN